MKLNAIIFISNMMEDNYMIFKPLYRNETNNT